MVKKKRLSKRVKLKDKYKVLRKVHEHKKKLKKQAKKNPRSRAPKEPAIPNSWPLKQHLLDQYVQEKEEAEVLKQHKKEEKKRNKKELKEQQQQQQQQQETSEGQGVQVIQTEPENQITNTDTVIIESLKQREYQHFKKVIETADVILEILDARDPLGSRCFDVEYQITRLYPKKQLVLVLNKIDLIPKENLTAWLTYLRSLQYLTIAFKSNVRLTRQEKEIASLTGNSSTPANNKMKSYGGNILLELLRNFRETQNLTNFTVGVIGYPNVGKSSFINSFRYKKRASASFSGDSNLYTGIALDEHIIMLDSPGVIFTDPLQSHTALKYHFNTNVADPLGTLQSIFTHFPCEKLLQIYRIPLYSDGMEFLRYIAEKNGKIKDGNFNKNAFARLILRDWNSSKIPHYTYPPGEEEQTTMNTSTKEWSDTFKLNDVLDLENQTIRSLKTNIHCAFGSVVSTTTLIPHVVFKKLDCDLKEILQEEEQQKIKGQHHKNQFKKKQKVTTSTTSTNTEEETFNLSSEQEALSSEKLKTKKKKKGSPQDYDFSTDFWTSPIDNMS